MAIEASIVPLPSELILIPAGFAIHAGELDLIITLLVSSAGVAVGSLTSYLLARSLGRPLIAKFGRYILVKEKQLSKAEKMYNSGAVTFSILGRFIPGVRSLVAFPAGIFRMGIFKFIMVMFMGALLSNSILIMLGYFFWDNKDKITLYTTELSFVGIAVGLIFLVYVIRKKKSINN